MASACPQCGVEMEFAERDVRLRTGTCGGCQHEFTFVEGTTLPGVGTPRASAASPDAGEAGDSSSAASVEGLACPECGASMSVSLGEGGALDVQCSTCDTRTAYLPASERPAFVPRERPARRRDATEEDDRGPASSRPCRQCGAPLRFSTGDDGMLTGECDSCGNRFTLPPRREFGGGRDIDRRRPGGFGRGPPRGAGGPRRFGRDDRRGAGSRPPFRRRGKFDDRPRSDDDGDDRRRRRRPPRSE